jgi:hypothetical protein
LALAESFKEHGHEIRKIEVHHCHSGIHPVGAAASVGRSAGGPTKSRTALTTPRVAQKNRRVEITIRTG